MVPFRFYWVDAARRFVSPKKPVRVDYPAAGG
jgi:hypothetical protein